MKPDEGLLEPLWDFTSPIQPLVPSGLPYSLDDGDYLSFLKTNFVYVLQLCFPPFAPMGDVRLYWRDLAHKLGNRFTLGVSFWQAIGVFDEPTKKDLSSWFSEPYFGLIDIGTWQSLRQVFGLPNAGICYADFIMYSPGQPGPILNENDYIRKTPQGFRYLTGRCLGETTEEIFCTESGVSSCWIEGEWFISVDSDLTRGVICFNSVQYLKSLAEDSDLECYLLQPREQQGDEPGTLNNL
ncbi:hypothetical protein [Corynebacterium sp. UMB10119B.1]|uniref:hypothetical protein n=1 Tax=Corynebacterium TaxID=1716 RepID=UPI002550FF37|nr:hypothetical protein [Corynebacterium sp. UMB10119B]MDK8363282.1 hypothetical protein [Corynebacterium sp. UMB10119B]